nr:putative nucleotidyltransferase, ribonuclease H [Tanacetum cinerariifolium]
QLPALPGHNIVAQNMAGKIEAIQAEVKQRLELSNAKYKASCDKHHRVKTFAIGDQVMVHLRKYRQLKDEFFLRGENDVVKTLQPT